MSTSLEGWIDGLEREGVDVDRAGALATALPVDEREIAVVLERAARDGRRVVPCGFAGQLGVHRPEALEGAVDVALSTRRLDAVTEYVPGDGTLTAQAGCSMSSLAETVREGGHRLTPDVPRPKEATLGGVLGASRSGPDRVRHGPARHHVLGMRVVLADGTGAKSGGKLVKNVTGFDLHRLYTGSRGTLCVVVEASLRLFPEPEHEVALTITAPEPRPALELAELARRLEVTPHAITVENALGAGWRLHIFLAGRTAQVEWERDRVLGGMRDAEVLEGEDASRLRQRVRDLGGAADSNVRLTCLPTQVAGAVETLRGSEAGRGGEPRTVVQPAVATVEARLTGFAEHDASRQVELLHDLRGLLIPAEVSLEVLAAPSEVHVALAPRLAERPDLRWMFALRERLDPKGLFVSPSFPGRQ